MIEQEDLRRIRHEERLRYQIRQEIEQGHVESEATAATPASEAPGWRSRLLSFLNSNLGMWLLSSVVLTGGAALIQQAQQAHQINTQNHQQLLMHVFEIQNRLDNMGFLLRRAKTVGEAKKALEGLFKSIYPLSNELQNRNLSSLYFSVYSLISVHHQKQVDDAIELVRRMEDAEYVLQSRPDAQALTEHDKVELEKLIKACKAIQADIGISRSR